MTHSPRESVLSTPSPHPIVLFDGDCGLCNASVNFIIDRDPAAIFQFAPLQSDLGRQLLLEHRLDPSPIDTLVLVEDGLAYVRSTAALRICRHLRWPWPLLRALAIIPRPLRDLAYNWVARHRKRWFGDGKNCRISDPLRVHRFPQ